MRVEIFCRLRGPGEISDENLGAFHESGLVVFNTARTTHDIYTSSASKLVRTFVGGRNVCYLTVGETGSGKSFALGGDKSAKTGLIFYVLGGVFTEIERQTSAAQISLQCLEINNEQMQDLFETGMHSQTLDVEFSAARGFHVPHSQHKPVSDVRSASSCFREAWGRRRDSPRSSFLFMIHLTLQSQDLGTIPVTSTFTLVEVPGVDRLARDPVELRLREGPKANASLIAFSEVVEALAENPDSDRVMNYRRSKLTELLSESLGGNCQTQCLVTMKVSSFGEPVHRVTLRLAQQMSHIENYPLVNSPDVQNLLCQYRARLSHYQKLSQDIAGQPFSDDADMHQENLRLRKEKIAVEEELNALKKRMASLHSSKADILQREEDYLQVSRALVELKMERLELKDKIIGLEAALDESNIHVHDQTQELDRLTRRASDLESLKYEQTASLHILEMENKGLKCTTDEQLTKIRELELEMVHLLNVKKHLQDDMDQQQQELQTLRDRLGGLQVSVVSNDRAEITHQQEVNHLNAALNRTAQESLQAKAALTQKVLALEEQKVQLEKKLLQATQSGSEDLSSIVRRYEQDIELHDRQGRDLAEQLVSKDKEVRLAKERADLQSAELAAEIRRRKDLELAHRRLQRDQESLMEEFRERLRQYMQEITQFAEDCAGVDGRETDSYLKAYVESMLNDVKATYTGQQERIMDDAKANLQRAQLMARSYSVLLNCYTKARRQLEKLGHGDLGPSVQSFQVPAEVDVDLLQPAELSLRNALQHAEDEAKHLREKVSHLEEEQQRTVESLQRRMAECLKESRGELDRRMALAQEDKDKQLVLLQRVTDLQLRLQRVGLQEHAPDEHAIKNDQAAARELEHYSAESQRLLEEEVADWKSRAFLAEQAKEKYETYISHNLVKLQKKNAQLRQAISHLLHVHAASSPQEQNQLMPPGIAELLANENLTN